MLKNRIRTINNPVRLSIWLFLLTGMFIWIFNTINVQSDLSMFLPKKQTFQHKLLISQLSNSAAARTIFITINSGNSDERVEMSQKLANHLRLSQYFEQVLNGDQSLSELDIRILLKYRYLLSENNISGFLSRENLKTALENRLEELSLPIPVFDKQYLPRDPGAELRHVLSRLNKKNTIHKKLGVWVDKEGGQAIIITRTHLGAVNLDEQQRIIDFIKTGFSQLNTNNSLSMQLTGLPVASTLSRKLIQVEVRWFSIIASVALIIVLLFSFRSVKFVLISTLPLLSAILAGLFVVLSWFHSIHGITLVFAITILGIAIDYPIHLFSHLGGELSSVNNMKKIWGTMLAGLSTTVVAFFTLVFSNFDGLYQLGLFTSSGLLAAAFTTRFILPDLIGATRLKYTPELNVLLLPKPLVIFFTVFSIAFVLVVFTWQLPEWDQNLGSLSPLPKSYNQRDHQLRTSLGVGDLRSVALVEGNSIEEVLHKSERLRPRLDQFVADGVINQYNMAALYLPSQALQEERKQHLPSDQQLKQNLTLALKGMPFKTSLLQPFLDDVNATRTLDYLVLKDFNGSVLEPLVRSLLINISDRYFGLIHLNGLTDKSRIGDSIQAIGADFSSAKAVVYNLKDVTTELMNDFYSDFLRHVISAVFFIIVILLVALKNLGRTLVVVTVLFLSLSVELAWLVVIGHQITLFHLVALILVFGLGLDYALFFTRKEAAKDKKKTIYGLLVCLASSILVFGILSLSSIPVLHIIGLTTAIGVFLAFFFSMLVSHFIHI